MRVVVDLIIENEQGEKQFYTRNTLEYKGMSRASATIVECGVANLLTKLVDVGFMNEVKEEIMTNEYVDAIKAQLS